MEVWLWEINSSACHSFLVPCVMMDLRVNVARLGRWNCPWTHSRFQFQIGTQMVRIKAVNVEATYVMVVRVGGLLLFHLISILIPSKVLFRFNFDCFFVIVNFFFLYIVWQDFSQQWSKSSSYSNFTIFFEKISFQFIVKCVGSDVTVSILFKINIQRWEFTSFSCQ